MPSHFHSAMPLLVFNLRKKESPSTRATNILTAHHPRQATTNNHGPTKKADFASSTLMPSHVSLSNTAFSLTPTNSTASLLANSTPTPSQLLQTPSAEPRLLSQPNADSKPLSFGNTASSFHPLREELLTNDTASLLAPQHQCKATTDNQSLSSKANKPG
jgi:hypothetical protein